ncbi:acetylserotonin O-methyltransferase [Actinomadura madurae]|uniref:acetylserotonin O-methyltransferase n=1 Tax=Actinomadura madurae TaxID=1993 RepID=UPI002025C06F|nr:acetylserotonin O-methyltransferase [Actinomadura madurae]URN01338.1 acetylserotonin O-methyltransferase [Actinomadura madurae]
MEGSTTMPRSPLMDLAFGFMPAQIIYAAAEIGLADAFDGDMPMSSTELAKETGAHAPSLHRLLRALTGLGVVEQRDRDLFSLTAEGRRLRADAPDSIRSLIKLFCGPEVWRTWGDMTETLRTGSTPGNGSPAGRRSSSSRRTPNRRRRSTGPWPSTPATSRRASSRPTTSAATGRSPISAGGDGTLLAAILRAHPGLRGVLFDLPAGLAAAPGTLADVAGRAEIVPGDFFASVPGGADAYVLKSVIHDWHDEKAAAILRNCRAAMRPDARVILLEQVMPEIVAPESAGIVRNDLNMLVATGGRERTEAEYRDLLDGAGFTVVALTGPLPPAAYHVIEAVPAR